MEEQREEIVIDDGQEEEIQDVKQSRDPGRPTAQEMEEHRCTHLPYRLWCKFCVMGRGRGSPHRPSPGSTVPIVGVDYFFITATGVVGRKELANADSEQELESDRTEGKVVKCIVVRCSSTKIVLAHVIPQKGVDEDMHVARLVTDDIAWLGHTKLIIKGDNEVSLQALIRRVIDMSKADCKGLESISKE